MKIWGPKPGSGWCMWLTFNLQVLAHLINYL